jgi:nitrogen regulatory protein P-II 1
VTLAKVTPTRRNTPVPRSPEFEDSLPDVASRLVRHSLQEFGRLSDVGSFRDGAKSGGRERRVLWALERKTIDERALSLNGFRGSQPLVMKKIEAIIKPFKLDDVREALVEIGVEGVTVTEVKMLRRPADHAAIGHGGEQFSEFLPKLKFEIVVADNRVRRTIRTIVSKARTGRINDGRVFVVPIQEAIRIRTGERGEAAV